MDIDCRYYVMLDDWMSIRQYMTHLLYMIWIRYRIYKNSTKLMCVLLLELGLSAARS